MNSLLKHLEASNLGLILTDLLEGNQVYSRDIIKPPTQANDQVARFTSLESQALYKEEQLRSIPHVLMMVPQLSSESYEPLGRSWPGRLFFRT